jgi:hypothetical protein
VSSESINKLITVIPFVSLQGLSLSSLNMSQQSIQLMIDVFNHSGDVIQLKYLNLQNNRIGDKMAIALSTSVFMHTRIEDYNLA